MIKRILIVAAHPDDEILGCSGTVARLISEGAEAYTLILGEGITSRNNENLEQVTAEKGELEKQLHKANEIIGVKKVFRSFFSDNQFDTHSMLEITKAIEAVKNEIKPDTIFTHYQNDLNIDHQITYQAVITATRPIQDESVKTIYSFEVLSSTEWSFPTSFSPNTFFDITHSIEQKKQAMAAYSMELREFPHPRSLKGIELSAQNWGMKVGLPAAESFILIRDIN